ncbi:hypothetical protein LC085_21730 [Bacillus tianshenii]|uniref:hypothetical protein n=1 Tax=Sutcliffiella tianshenii TaxID=1463404 RepID=UPI001CD716C3|nr:hypothetical protein [Bacillus tianshenii]MCA1322498.1 hypothetical protein [Bacillus tianshenii]
MIGAQDVDSCGRSGTGETPQTRKRRGGSPAARGKRSLAWKSTAVFNRGQRGGKGHSLFSEDSFSLLGMTVKEST